MTQPKLFRILSTFTPDEWKGFGRYVHSPFFTVHEDTVQFFELIEPHYPDFEAPELEAEAIFEALYPGISFSDVQIRTLRKYLLRLAEGFLVQLKLRQDEPYEQQALIEALEQRGLDALIPRLVDESRTALEMRTLRNEPFYSHMFTLEQLAWQQRLKYGQRTAPQDFVRMIAPLDYAYLIQKLGYSCPALNQQIQQGIPAQIPLLDEVMQYCRGAYADMPALVQAYYLTASLLRMEGNDAELEKLLSLLAQEGDTFGKTDMINLCGYAINYCNYRYRAGDSHRLQTMLDIYKLMLEKDLLFEQGRISLHQFKNLSTLGIRLEAWEWTETFIHTYNDRLDAEHRDGVYQYSLAQLAAARQQHRQALRHLQAVTFIDPFYRISYNLLLLKIYYECMEAEPLLSLTQTLRAFLRRKKNMSDRQQLAYAHFARLTRALFMAKIKSAKNLQAIHEDILQCEPLIEREWLLKKWAQLAV
ncbi:MAG: hypothetical protein SF053_22175 [Bacteroidia bacterium]|nr:hypothetical protein [Bacteroidia bacterium]